MDNTERQDFEQHLADLRPRLHRYCSRMVGSSIDGEDVVQDTFVKALAAFADQKPDNAERWVFSIAHNAAIDFLRWRKRLEKFSSDQDPDLSCDDKADVARRVVAHASIRPLMQLPATQRGCAALADVLGYSLKEIGEITGMTVPAVKAALNRARRRLREIAGEPASPGPHSLGPADLARLSAYADRFNARDFDAVRDMLAEEVRLELVARTRMEGKAAVSTYFGNYGRVRDWRLEPGRVDGQPALLVLDPSKPGAPPAYFVLVEFDGSKIARIRDFRHAPYVIREAEVIHHDAVAGGH